MNWPAVTAQERASRVNDMTGADDGWAGHQRACTAEGLCPVCFGPLGGPGPSPGYAVAAGNCESPRCPAAPCRWAVSTAQPHSGIGALMYAPLRRDR